MMYQKLMVAMDHGNRNMKTENFIFTSGLVESDCRPALGDYLRYQDKFYSLSEQRIPYMRDKTADERFFALTLFGIAMEAQRQALPLESSSLQVELAVGLPPKHYGALYEKFEEYFRNRGKQQILYRGKKYDIEICDVAAYPQDYAAAMTAYSQIVDYDRVLTVDIGGFTLDYLLLRGGRPDLSVCESLEKGVIRLYNDVISRINSEKDILLEEQDVDRIIQGKRTDYPQDIVEVVENMTRTYVEDIIGTLRERGLDLKTGCVVWIGGGAMLLKKHLESSSRIGNSIFVEDICANAKGYGILYQLQQRGR